MLLKISRWAAIIGVATTTISFTQAIAVAKSAGEIADTVSTATGSIARAKKQGAGDLFESAIQKQNQGDDLGALADYDRIVRLNPKSANAYYNRGLLKATKLQDDRGALADYNRAIQLKPSYDAAYNNRGNLKREKLKDYQGALADYDRAIQLNPKSASAYYNRGALKYTLLTDRSGGIADMQQASKLAQSQGSAQNYQAAIDLLNEWQQTSGLSGKK